MPIGDIEEEELYIKDPTNTPATAPPATRPEEELWLAVLQQALEDATLLHNPTQNRLVHYEEWLDAINWIFTESYEVHGFDWLVQSLSKITKSAKEIRRAVSEYQCPKCLVFIIEQPCECVAYRLYEGPSSSIA